MEEQRNLLFQILFSNTGTKSLQTILTAEIRETVREWETIFRVKFTRQNISQKKLVTKSWTQTYYFLSLK